MMYLSHTQARQSGDPQSLGLGTKKHSKGWTTNNFANVEGKSNIIIFSTDINWQQIQTLFPVLWSSLIWRQYTFSICTHGFSTCFNTHQTSIICNIHPNWLSFNALAHCTSVIRTGRCFLKTVLLLEFVSWLFNVPAPCNAYLRGTGGVGDEGAGGWGMGGGGADLPRQFDMLAHWDRFCRWSWLSHPVSTLTLG